MKKLVMIVLLLAMVIAPMGCRAFMVGGEAIYMSGVAVVDPVDSGTFWEDFGDYLDSAGKSMRTNLREVHRGLDHYFMLHDWDDPSL